MKRGQDWSHMVSFTGSGQQRSEPAVNETVRPESVHNKVHCNSQGE